MKIYVALVDHDTRRNVRARIVRGPRSGVRTRTRACVIDGWADGFGILAGRRSPLALASERARASHSTCAIAMALKFMEHNCTQLATVHLMTV